jgi:hypothetical protein
MGKGEAKLQSPREISNGCTDSVQSGETPLVATVAGVVRRLLNRLLHNSVKITGIWGFNLSAQGARCWNKVLGLEVTVRNPVGAAGKKLLPSAARLTKRRFSERGFFPLANTACVAPDARVSFPLFGRREFVTRNPLRRHSRLIPRSWFPGLCLVCSRRDGRG